METNESLTLDFMYKHFEVFAESHEARNPDIIVLESLKKNQRMSLCIFLMFRFAIIS